METLLLHALIYLFIGACAGLMAGLFGVGGGLIVVPGLAFVFQHTHIIPDNILMYVAVGTSLAAMIITSQAAVKSHHKLGNVLWQVFHKLWTGLIPGTIAGSIAATWIPTYWLRIFFGIFLLVVAVRMLTAKPPSRQGHFPQPWIIFISTFSIGLISGLLGIGGGVLIVPFMAYCGVEMRKIAALSNLCALAIALTGAIAFMIIGLQDTRAIPFTTGYVYWPAVFLIGITSSLLAPIGTQLNYSLPVHQLKYGFIILLILTALKMLI